MCPNSIQLRAKSTSVATWDAVVLPSKQSYESVVAHEFNQNFFFSQCLRLSSYSLHVDACAVWLLQSEAARQGEPPVLCVWFHCFRTGSVTGTTVVCRRLCSTLEVCLQPCGFCKVGVEVIEEEWGTKAIAAERCWHSSRWCFVAVLVRIAMFEKVTGFAKGPGSDPGVLYLLKLPQWLCFWHFQYQRLRCGCECGKPEWRCFSHRDVSGSSFLYYGKTDRFKK